MKQIDVSLARALAEKYETEYEWLGFRFDERKLKNGAVLSNSKHNPDRVDERDFPEYGTSEYDELDELDGTSCYNVNYFFATYGVWEGDYSEFINCYLIGSNKVGDHDEPDDGEMLLKAPIVLGKIL